MITFSSDVDILKHEPALFGTLHLPAFVRAAGSGATLSGTTLTAPGADFVAAHIPEGGVVHLRSADAALDGPYEIVSVEGPTQLTVSVVRADRADPAIAPRAAVDIAYRVCSFEAQAGDVAFPLTEYFGLRPGDPGSEIGVEDLLDTQGLRQASALAVIATVYTIWSDAAGGEAYRQKSQQYQQLFERARQRCHLTIDLDADGVADVTRVGGAIRLVRD